MSREKGSSNKGPRYSAPHLQREEAARFPFLTHAEEIELVRIRLKALEQAGITLGESSDDPFLRESNVPIVYSQNHELPGQKDQETALSKDKKRKKKIFTQVLKKDRG